jgi:DNA-binding response OmpR family regulator
MGETVGTDGMNPKKILVIEDSPTQALHLQGLLEEEGFRVIVARDGEAGLQTAQKARPDVVVLDLEMAGMNGLQVCQRLKEMRQTTSIPVIMFTRHDDPEVMTLGMQIGAVDYIPKDAFADTTLLETLRQMELDAPCAAGA